MQKCCAHPAKWRIFLHSYRIVVAGPTTLAAILSSLRMGFRTLAIEKRSSEVWGILAAVKTEFGKFGDVMDKLRRQLNTASKTVDETGTRTRAMERQLRSGRRAAARRSNGAARTIRRNAGAGAQSRRRLNGLIAIGRTDLLIPTPPLAYSGPARSGLANPDR